MVVDIRKSKPEGIFKGGIAVRSSGSWELRSKSAMFYRFCGAVLACIAVLLPATSYAATSPVITTITQPIPTLPALPTLSCPSVVQVCRWINQQIAGYNGYVKTWNQVEAIHAQALSYLRYGVSTYVSLRSELGDLSHIAKSLNVHSVFDGKLELAVASGWSDGRAITLNVQAMQELHKQYHDRVVSTLKSIPELNRKIKESDSVEHAIAEAQATSLSGPQLASLGLDLSNLTLQTLQRQQVLETQGLVDQLTYHDAKNREMALSASATVENLKRNAQALSMSIP